MGLVRLHGSTRNVASFTKLAWFKYIGSNKYEARVYLSTKPKPSLPVKMKEEEKLIRNVGIIAHIDAGKTTTTERMLYYSGFSRSMGEVHDGDTVMDFMEQERDRGITISSAAITFNWKNHQINLIDTPGHVDFTVEVERALRVLDGAVTILDASAGVEAQTLTVWSQANVYKVPRLVYLNKMDKPKADIKQCMVGLVDKLKTTPLLIHVPITNESDFFIGVIDLLRGEAITWENAKDGKNFEKLSVSESSPFWNDYVSKREALVESIADMDIEIAEKLILSESTSSILHEELELALRRITLSNKGVVVMCGSSYKNIGVQLLLDSIISYLPSPSEVTHDFLKFYSDAACGLIFKIIHDKRLGILTFIRVYSGFFEEGQKLYNVNRDKNQIISKMFQAFADDFRNVPSVSKGNIAIVTGIKDAVTGDTIVSAKSAAERARKTYAKETNLKLEEVNPVLAGIRVPDPVFFCSIEAPSLSFQKPLENALECLQREDPTLKISYNSDWGQTVISGMGELHIEVIKDRIKIEYGVDAYLGPLQVSYRETPSMKANETFQLDKRVGGVRQIVTICMSLKPAPDYGPFKKLIVIPNNENNLGHLLPDHLKAMRAGIDSTLEHGSILSFPVIDLTLQLNEFQTSRSTTMPFISAATSQCLRALLKKSEPRLMEPIMKLEITVEENYHGVILADLNHRRSNITNVHYRDDIRVIEAETPLVELKKYSSYLRKLTSGRASFTMEFIRYQLLSQKEQSEAIKSVTGF